MKRTCYFLAGVLVGAVLFGGSVAYAAGVIAERSMNTIYIDGRQVELEAYSINGSNYLKLRDVGKARGFNVYWDGAGLLMILASAMRHSVGRPAHGNGGRHEIPMERLCQPPSEPAFVLYREQENTAPPNGAKFVVNASHGETHFYLTGADDEKRTSQNKRSRYD